MYIFQIFSMFVAGVVGIVVSIFVGSVGFLGLTESEGDIFMIALSCFWLLMSAMVFIAVVDLFL